MMQVVIRLYREARRRNVFRTGGLYVLGAWLVLQVADVLFPGFGIPDSAIQALVWAAILGFPVALAFAWLYEIGPGGIRRTPSADSDALPEPQPLARRDRLILGAFGVIAAVLVFRAAQGIREAPLAGSPGTDVAALDASDRLANSVAVLPFANISNDPDNTYFCDGVAEEILQKLADFRGLNVIGRTSSFAFRDSKQGIDQISRLLRVHYVLQGSVRKAGETLRVSAQLLDQKGVQVWAESFDRKLVNVFEIQSEIAAAVAPIVAEHVLPRPRAGPQPNLAAYERYLDGRALLHRRDWQPAVRELERAVKADPMFAEAHAELAIARLIFATGLTPEELEATRRSIDRALELSPGLLRARAARGFWMLSQVPPDAAGAERVLRDVLAQDPNMSDALLWLSIALDKQGRSDEARTVLERAALVDPFHPDIITGVALRLLGDGETERARALLERQLEQPAPGFPTFHSLRELYRVTGQLTEMNAVAKSLALDSSNPNYFSLALSYALIGDWSAANAWMKRSMGDFPDWPFAPFQPTVVPAWQGRFEESARELRTALAERQWSIRHLGIQWQLILGGVLARAGEHDAAIGVLAPLVADGMTVVSGHPELYAPHALAWSYFRTGARDEALSTLSRTAQTCARSRAAGRLGLSSILQRCAETELLLGHTDEALDGLEQAVAAGWREYYLRVNDPYWAAVADHPRYRALMARVKQDVDRQRAEIEAIDAREDFTARLDAAIASRRR